MAFKYEIGFTGACMLKDDSQNEGLVVLLVDASEPTDVAFMDDRGPQTHTVAAHVPALIFANANKSDLTGATAEPAHPPATHSYLTIPPGHVTLLPAPSGSPNLVALKNLGKASDHTSAPAQPVADPGLGAANLNPFVARMAIAGGVLRATSRSPDWIFQDPHSRGPSPTPAPMMLPDEAVLEFSGGDTLEVKTAIWTLTLKHPQDGTTLRIDIKNLPQEGITNPGPATPTSPGWHWDLFYKAFAPAPLLGSRPLPFLPSKIVTGPNNAAPRCHPSQFP